MPITKLEPLRLKDEFYLNIEKALTDYFYRLIYAPMYNEVADEIGKDWAQIYNAKSQELAEPLQKHLLFYISFLGFLVFLWYNLKYQTYPSIRLKIGYRLLIPDCWIYPHNHYHGF